jgi:restriction system protein
MGQIDLLPGEAFEEVLLLLFRDLGWQGELTQRTGDFGADLLLKIGTNTTIVQAKRQVRPVGIEAVQQAHGARGFYDAVGCMVVTNATFTPAARRLAQTVGVELWDRHRLAAELARARGRV